MSQELKSPFCGALEGELAAAGMSLLKAVSEQNGEDELRVRPSGSRVL